MEQSQLEIDVKNMSYEISKQFDRQGKQINELSAQM